MPSTRRAIKDLQGLQIEIERAFGPTARVAAENRTLKVRIGELTLDNEALRAAHGIAVAESNRVKADSWPVMNERLKVLTDERDWALDRARGVPNLEQSLEQSRVRGRELVNRATKLGRELTAARRRTDAVRGLAARMRTWKRADAVETADLLDALLDASGGDVAVGADVSADGDDDVFVLARKSAVAGNTRGMAEAFDPSLLSLDSVVRNESGSARWDESRP